MPPTTPRPPLHLCALTLQPHKTPVAAPDGSIFESANITQLIRRTNLNPISGQPLQESQLTNLIFSTDSTTSTYRCPILFTPLSKSTKVIAIATTGRVYSAAAITRLNIQPNYMRDLVDATPFTLQDLLILYDPAHHTWTPPPENASPSSSARASTTPPSVSPLPPPPPIPSHLKSHPTIPPPISIRRQTPRPTMTLQSVHRRTIKPELFRPSSTPDLPRPPVYSPPVTTPEPSRRHQPSTHPPHPLIPPTSAPAAPRMPPAPAAPAALVAPAAPGAAAKPRVAAVAAAAAAAAGPMVGPAAPAVQRRAARGGGGPPAKKPRRAVVQNVGGGAVGEQMSMTMLYQKRIAEEERKAVYKKIRKGRKGKGYVRVVTNIGHLNIELHCDKVPTTCDNFLTLAERNYYDGLLWHRVVPGFIAQTGDPTGKGDSGDSAWGGYVKDEIRTSLNHDAAGVVSMANSGRDTNRSQWFVCFEAARHLDGAHTVFGKVVGGLFVLKKMESEAELGHPLTVERVEVLVNPIRQIREQMAARERQLQMDTQRGAAPVATSSPQSSTPTEGFPSNPVSCEGEQRGAGLPRVHGVQVEKRADADRASRRLSLDRIVQPELPPAKTLLSAATQAEARFSAAVKNR